MRVRRCWGWLLSLLLLGTGCWSRREVNEVAISSAIAIDEERNQTIRITMQILRPTAAVESGQPRSGTFNVTATGPTTAAAIRNLDQQLSRRPEWKHNNAIILSENVARQGVGEIMDFFMRNHQSRLDQWILVTRGKAAAVLVPRFQLESNQGIGIRRLNQSAVHSTAATVPVRLYDFVTSLTNPAEDPVAAAIETVEFPDPSGEGEVNPRIRMRGAAVFQHDRLAGWLDETEARSLDWFRGEATGAMVVVPCRKGPGRGTSVQLISTRSSLQPYWKNGQPAVRATVRATGQLGDLMCQEDLSKHEALVDLQRRTAAQMEAEMAKLMHRLQKDLGSDAVGLGVALERTFPAAWKKMSPQWREIFPKVSVTPEVVVELTQMGTSEGKLISSGGGGK
ncbi:MAG: Germination protein Ger(X)C family [Symbiobacteriaceae bacterium]|jgi:spore germination protein KC|nr:Germination protein Ger(X)C family [Symbiobacteriaceae bacterium]